MSPNIRKWISIPALLTVATISWAGDLSSYREFQLGMDLNAVKKQTSEARTIHQRPALIQDLEWRPRGFGSAAESDPVKDVLLSFYNGQLFRIVVNYDRYKTD